MKPYKIQTEGPKEFLTKHIKLSSSEKPTIVKHLQNCNIEKQQRAVFECVVRGTPDMQIIWYKNGTPIESSPDCLADFDKNTGRCTLTLSRALPEDSGQYTCIAYAPAGEDSSTAWLNVTDQPQEVPQVVPSKHHVSRKPKEAENKINAPLRISSIESSKTESESITRKFVQEIPSKRSFDGKPEFVVPLNDANLVEGGQAVFQCAVQGKEPIKIQWFKQNKEIIPQYRYKASYDPNTGIARLVITTLLEDDAGKYSCKATNEFGDDTTTSNLGPSGYTRHYSEDSEQMRRKPSESEPVI